MENPRLAVFVIAAALAGCAQQPTVDWEDALPTLSVMRVCEAALVAPPDYAEPAAQEARRRGVNCNDYSAAIMQQRAINAQTQHMREAEARAAGRRILSTPTSRSLGPGCSTINMGGTAQTNCN